jgi:branched-chain amino acid transport system substrate-binding protein
VTLPDCARENTLEGFKIVYNKSYSPSTTDFAPVVRAVRATDPDIVYTGAYPPDNVGIIRAANEIGLSPKMMGGAMIGMLVTPIKVQLGPVANGLIVGENFAAAFAPKIPGSADFLKRYGERAAAVQIDPLGFAWGPFAYSAGQTLAQAVTATKSLDHDKLAAYMHKASFKTVSGDFSFGEDGEWSKAWSGPRSRTRNPTTSISSVTGRRSRSSGRPRPRPAP